MSLKISIYGYRNHRYAKVEDDYRRSKYYIAVDDDVEPGDVGVEHRTNEYGDYRGINVVTKGNVYHCDEYDAQCSLPYTNPKLYTVIDLLFDLAEKIDIDISSYVERPYSYDLIHEFVKELSLKAEEDCRLVELLRGKDILDLLKSLDKERQIIASNEKLLKEKDDSIEKLTCSLQEKDELIEKYKKNISKLTAENMKYQLERDGYKKEITSKIVNLLDTL